VITRLGLRRNSTQIILLTLEDNIMDGARRRGVGGAGPLSLRSNEFFLPRRKTPRKGDEEKPDAVGRC
jgi:hypothetical protein